MSRNESLRVVQEPSADALASVLADRIVDALQRDLDARGEASLVVSGGSTPKPLFAALSERELAWHQVTVTLADERWVPESDPDSNAAFVKQHLLRGEAAAARFVGLYASDCTPEAGATQIKQALTAVPRPFTVVVLGMGGDGHTASLFPDAPGTAEAMIESASPVGIVRPATVPQTRITLTLAALMDTDCQLLHITGAAKRQLVDEVLQDPQSSEYPIAQFLRSDNSRLVLYTTH